MAYYLKRCALWAILALGVAAALSAAAAWAVVLVIPAGPLSLLAATVVAIVVFGSVLMVVGVIGMVKSVRWYRDNPDLKATLLREMDERMPPQLAKHVATLRAMP